MSRRSPMIVALIALVLVPGAALAQRGRYSNTPAMGPDGPIYNPTMSPEYRQAGGNPEVYQQLMEQKEAAAYQKQVDAYQKQMAAYLKANPQAKKQLEAQQKQYEAMQQKQQQILWGRAPSKKKSSKKYATAKTRDVAKDDTSKSEAVAKDATPKADAKPVAGTPAKPTLSQTRAANNNK